MTVTTVYTRTTTLTTDDLPFDAVLESEPCEWIDPVVYKREDGTYTVAYALLDEFAESPFDFDNGVEFEEFTNEWDRDEFYNSTDTTTHVAYIVDHFEHSSHRYTLLGTLEHLGMYYRFDSRPSGVLRVPLDFTDTKAAAVSLLEEYTSWVNGDVYGIVREDFDAEGNQIGYESVWGFIGSEYAESAIKNIDAHL